MDSRPSQVRRAVAAALVVAQLTLALSGCVSVKTRTTRTVNGKGGGVALQVFADDGARRAGRVGPAGLVGELERREGKGWKPVFRSLDPRWAVVGLPEGTYRVGFPARLSESGDVERLDNPTRKVFKVRDGMMTDVQVTLEHVSPALVAVGIVTVVVAAVLISEYLGDHDLPEPPVPPEELVELAFHISLDLAVQAAWSADGDRMAPVVTSHFPASGALVAARRPKVIFCLSEPLAGRELEPDGVVVLGEKSGVISGTVHYDPANWWVVWTPGQDLPAGDRFHATLAGDAVEDLAGNEPGKPASFSFKTAP